MARYASNQWSDASTEVEDALGTEWFREDKDLERVAESANLFERFALEMMEEKIGDEDSGLRQFLEIHQVSLVPGQSGIVWAGEEVKAVGRAQGSQGFNQVSFTRTDFEDSL